MTDFISENGVVGAGGAGFPAAAKLKAKADTFLVNAAECEPLLHKDRELMAHYSAEMFKGIAEGVSRVGARQAVIGIKEKHQDIIEMLRPLLPSGVSLHSLPDVYPAGDEFILVHEITGRIIPPGGLPVQVGVVVNNVETLVNIGLNKPVTHKFLTVAGAVKKPCTLRVPLGVTIREVIAAAGGAVDADYGVLKGGVMMGSLAKDLDEPVTKTLGGLIVLPGVHHLIERYRRPWKAAQRIGRAACDQCSFCTDLCPRYLLGHPIEPHLAMRSLGFMPDKDSLVAGTLFCCECNLCSLISCPEGLDPKDACKTFKADVKERGIKWQGDLDHLTAHPMAEYRRVPTSRLINQLGLAKYESDAHLVKEKFEARRVSLPLKQHIGAACEVVVKVGQHVSEGELLARVPEGQLGASLHSSISGVVRSVDQAVLIEA